MTEKKICGKILAETRQNERSDKMENELYGILAVNNFIEQQKFTELYRLLFTAARKEKVRLEVKKTGELLRPLGTALEPKPDFVLFWDKDIICAKMLEDEGIPVFNSAQAIEYCDNKALTCLYLQKSKKIKIPKTVIAPKTFEAFGYCNTDFVEYAAGLLSFPLVIKECYGSYGSQVYLVFNIDEAKKTVKSLGSHEFIMQEFISSSYGKDVRVNVVGGKTVVCMLRHNENGDFRSNISSGGSMSPYEPDEEMKKAAEESVKTLGLDFAGVDVLFGDDGYYICEVNSNPHFKSTLDCTGVNLAEYIIRHIKNKLNERGE